MIWVHSPLVQITLPRRVIFQSFECQSKSMNISATHQQSPGSFTLVVVLLHSPEPSPSCCHSDPEAALHSLLTPLPTSPFKPTPSRSWPCPINHLPKQTQLILVASQSNSFSSLNTIESHRREVSASFSSMWNELWLKHRWLRYGRIWGPLGTKGIFLSECQGVGTYPYSFLLLLRASFQG